MNLVDDTGSIVPEPDWQSLFSDVLEIGQAHEHWRRVTTELRDRGLMSPGNAHALQRLVVAYVLYDRVTAGSCRERRGDEAEAGNPKAIARTSPHFAAMRELGSDAAVLEAEFGLSPRRRSVAMKAERKKTVVRAGEPVLRQEAQPGPHRRHGDDRDGRRRRGQ